MRDVCTYSHLSADERTRLSVARSATPAVGAANGEHSSCAAVKSNRIQLFSRPAWPLIQVRLAQVSCISAGIIYSKY